MYGRRNVLPGKVYWPNIPGAVGRLGLGIYRTGALRTQDQAAHSSLRRPNEL